jgi:hypothetical protein
LQKISSSIHNPAHRFTFQQLLLQLTEIHSASLDVSTKLREVQISLTFFNGAPETFTTSRPSYLYKKNIMKKILSILVVFTVLVSGVKANDIEKPNSEAGLAVLKSKTGFKLLYKGTKRNDVKVTIYNASGNTVHQETLRNTQSFSRPYNLQSLSDGAYTVEVRDANGTQLKTVEFSRKRDQLNAKLSAIPGVANKYVLRIPKKSGLTGVSIKIFDAKGQLVYSGSENVESDFARVYDLSKVSGNFSIDISDGKGNYQTLSN